MPAKRNDKWGYFVAQSCSCSFYKSVELPKRHFKLQVLQGCNNPPQRTEGTVWLPSQTAVLQGSFKNKKDQDVFLQIKVR